MKTAYTSRPKSKPLTPSFEDLNDEAFQDLQWNPAALLKAMPKQHARVKKMKNR